MESKQITHWSPQEELHYNLFLIFKADQLLTYKNKATGFYVTMSQFIHTRSKVQCRSHHEKMVSRFRVSSSTNKRDLEEQNLRSFYRDHVQLRLLDSCHLLKQIEHHLTQKLNRGIIKKDFYCQFKERAEKNLHMLNFQDHIKKQEVTEQKPQKLELLVPSQKTPSEPQNYQLSYLFPPAEEQPFMNLFYFEDESEYHL